MALPVNRAWVKAAIVCAAVSTVIALGAPMLFSDGLRYVPPVEWDRVGKMTYDEATKYLMERSERVSSWQAFLEGASHGSYWLEVLKGWLLMFIFSFLCCSILIRWLGVGRAPSNPTVERDARKSDARPSP